jgi:hypothetical protein
MSRLLLAPSFVAVALALACDSSPPPPPSIRIANLVPDSQAVDVCLKPSDVAAFGTPFVGGAGLSYPALSSRATVDAGTYSVRVVAGGATNCSTSLNGLGDISNVQLGEGAIQTLAVLGRLTGTGSPSVALGKYDDRIAPTPSGGVSMRAVNAAPGANPEDVGVVSGSFLSPFATAVSYGNVSQYQTLAFTPGATNGTAPLAARDSTTQAVWASATFTNVSDTGVYTVYVIGIPGQTGTARPALLLCSDNSVNCAQSP